MQDKKYHTTEESIERTQNLTDLEMVALMIRIEPFSRHSRFTCPADLLHDVLERLCDGRRQWPIGLDFLTLVQGIARSVVDAERKRKENSAYSIEELMDWEAQGREGPSAVLMEICKATSTPSAEDEAIGRERIRIVAELNVRASAALAKDALAKRAAEGYLEGLTPSEIAEELNIDPKAMRAADQRAWRAFMKAGMEMGLGKNRGTKK